MLLMVMTMDEALDVDKKLSYAWLAGILDGEGWIGIAKVNIPSIKNRLNSQIRIVYLPVISVQMTDEATIRRIAQITNCGFEDWARQKNPKCRLLYRWRVSKWTRVREVLGIVYPYLFTKKRQTAAVIKFVDNRKFKREGSNRRTLEDLEYCERYYRLLREMNRRGNGLSNQYDIQDGATNRCR